MTRENQPLDAVRITVRGIVQGVGFRYACRDTAARLGLRGWVRNLPDGNVEVAASGAPEALQQLIAWCREGPPLAVVRECRVEPLPGGIGGNGFEIRY